MARKTEPFAEYPEWSTAKFWSFVRSALRAAWSRWPPKYKVLNAAKSAYSGPNKKQKYQFKCAMCKGQFLAKEVSVDHIVPAGQLRDYSDLPEFVSRLFVAEDMLRVLCNECHRVVTKQQNSTSARVLHPREESSYRNMISRCYNPNSTGYEAYGGRGIKVCDSWRESFYNFLHDMGSRPENTSLDRIDVNGDYELANCRWADTSTQANNKTGNVKLTYNGETKTVSEWAKSQGILPNTLQYRLYRGWSLEEALGTKPRQTTEERRMNKE